MLKIHTEAPDFSLPDQNGVIHTLEDYKDKKVVIYFYPKDDTPGCTKEACAITEVYSEFRDLGTHVIGVSVDSPGSHKKFADKYHLPFTLLSDPKLTMIDAYEARGSLDKAKRVSYLLDEEGKIIRVYPDVDPANHAVQILADIKNL